MEELLTVAELAKLMKLSQSWIYGEVEAGRIPYKRLGKSSRTVRFDRAEIRKWLKSRPGDVEGLIGGEQAAEEA